MTLEYLRIQFISYNFYFHKHIVAENDWNDISTSSTGHTLILLLLILPKDELVDKSEICIVYQYRTQFKNQGRPAVCLFRLSICPVRNQNLINSSVCPAWILGVRGADEQQKRQVRPHVLCPIDDCNLILDPKFKRNPSYRHNKKVETGTKNGDIFFIGIEKISQKLWFGTHNNFHIKIMREKYDQN